jgi:hypothetical protein
MSSQPFSLRWLRTFRARGGAIDEPKYSRAADDERDASILSEMIVFYHDVD